MNRSKQSFGWLSGASLLVAALGIGIQVAVSDEQIPEQSARANRSKAPTPCNGESGISGCQVPPFSEFHEMPQSGRLREMTFTRPDKIHNPSPPRFPDDSHAAALHTSHESQAHGPEPDLWLEVSPESPGQHLVSGNLKCEVIAYQVSDAGSAADWIVKISGIGSPELNPTAENPGSRFTYGFTREQELFRTKWGWKAFDQVRKDLIAPQ